MSIWLKLSTVQTFWEFINVHGDFPFLLRFSVILSCVMSTSCMDQTVWIQLFYQQVKKKFGFSMVSHLVSSIL